MRARFDPLLARLGPDFRDQLISGLMTNFTDEAHALMLAQYQPAQATSGGRVSTGRALETIAVSADVKARVLPALASWVQGLSSRGATP